MGGVEQALLIQAALELLKGHRQRAHAVRLQAGHIDLILPAFGKQTHPAVKDDLHAAFRPEAQLGRV